MPPSEPLSVTLERIGDADAARDDWSRLALAGGNVFSSPEWADVWSRHLAGGEPLDLVGFRRADGELAGLLPLAVGRKGPLRVARIAGHGPADQLGPICAPAERAVVARAIKRAIDAGELRGLLIGDRLDPREGWVEALDGRVLHSEPSPTLGLEGRDWESYLAGRSSNFRSQVRRAERKLVKDHGLTYRLCESHEALQADFGTLVRLHRARWGAESESYEDGLEAFHRDFAAVALDRGWLRLWLAEVDGEPIAAWLGFRYAGAESFYQAGRDPEWERTKVGFALLAHTIRSAFEDGMREYRFLRGGESYKARFADDEGAVETVALGHGPAARLAVAGGARLAASPRGRRVLSALVG